MADQQKGPTLIQSVQRALHLLEAVAEHEGRANAKEIARTVRIPLATCYHLLRTCTHEGWLERLGDGSYVLGHRFDTVRSRSGPALGLAHARPVLQWLRDELDSAVYLALEREGEILIADIVDGPRAPRIDLWVGMHDAAHATALGKCVLGQLTPEGREDYLARHPLHDLTPHTVVDRRRLRLPAPEDVAVDDQEYALGVRCLAVPVVTGHGAASLGIATRGAHWPERVRGLLSSGAGRVSRALALTSS